MFLYSILKEFTINEKEAVVLSTGTGLDASGNQILTGKPTWAVATDQTCHFASLPMKGESDGEYISRVQKLFPKEPLPIVKPGDDPLTIYKEWALSNFNKYDLKIFEDFIRKNFENEIVPKKAKIIDRGVGGNKEIEVEGLWIELKPTKENPSGLIPKKSVCPVEPGTSSSSTSGGLKTDIPEDLYVTVYHGSSSQVQTDNLRTYGPDPNKPYFLTSSKLLAERAAGPNGKVLTYRVPKERASEILGEPKPYIGMIGEGDEYKIIGEQNKRINGYLDSKDKIGLY